MFWAARPTDLSEWQEYFPEVSNFPSPPQAHDAAADVLLALGKYDGELSELQAAAPRRGEPLKYRKTDTSQFVLCSVGRNQTDEGGTPHMNRAGTNIDRGQGDWVWQFPGAIG